MPVAMREAAGSLIAAWRERGRELAFGAGIAQGYATLGQIGFAERSGYTAIGTVCNLAARLCAEAKDGQILLAQRLAVAVEEIAGHTARNAALSADQPASAITRCPHMHQREGKTNRGDGGHGLQELATLHFDRPHQTGGLSTHLAC